MAPGESIRVGVHFAMDFLPQQNRRVAGDAVPESEAILAMLLKHLARPDFTYRHVWADGDTVVWDNRSTQHKPVNDYFPAHRRLQRITIDGDRPY